MKHFAPPLFWPLPNFWAGYATGSVNTFKSKLQLLSSRLQSGNLRNFPDMQEELLRQGKGVTQLENTRKRSMSKTSYHNLRGVLPTSHPSSL